MTKGVAAIGLHIPCGAVVVFEYAQDLLQLLFDTGILHRHDALLAAEKVAPHPVGGADEEFGIAPIFKTIDASVLQEAADRTKDVDVLGQARNPRTQAA